MEETKEEKRVILYELLEYRKRLLAAHAKARTQTVRVKLQEEANKIFRTIMSNSPEKQIYAWLGMFKKELKKKLDENWVVKVYGFEQVSKTKSGEILRKSYNQYFCLIKEGSPLLNKNKLPHNEFYEYILASNFKKNFNERIYTHAGYTTKTNVNELETVQKFMQANRFKDNTNFKRTKQILASQKTRVDNRKDLIVFNYYNTPKLEKTEKYKANGKFMGEKVLVMPNKNILSKTKWFKHIDNPIAVVEYAIYKATNYHYARNHTARIRYNKELDIDQWLKRDEAKYNELVQVLSKNHTK